MVTGEDVARRWVGERFPGARAAWLGGRVVAVIASPTSDLDVHCAVGWTARFASLLDVLRELGGGVDPSFIDPASPWQNGTCESFNGRFRDEFLTAEQFGSMLEVQVLAEDWRIEYNTYRPTARWTSSPPRPTGRRGAPPNRARPHQRSHTPWHHNRGPVNPRWHSRVSIPPRARRPVRLHRQPCRLMTVETYSSDIWLSTDDWAEAFAARDFGTPHNEARDQIWEELFTILMDSVSKTSVIRRASHQDLAVTWQASGACWLSNLAGRRGGVRMGVPLHLER